MGDNSGKDICRLQITILYDSWDCAKNISIECTGGDQNDPEF